MKCGVCRKNNLHLPGNNYNLKGFVPKSSLLFDYTGKNCFDQIKAAVGKISINLGGGEVVRFEKYQPLPLSFIYRVSECRTSLSLNGDNLALHLQCPKRQTKWFLLGEKLSRLRNVCRLVRYLK